MSARACTWNWGCSGCTPCACICRCCRGRNGRTAARYRARPSAAHTRPNVVVPPREEPGGSSGTLLLSDELTALCRFMSKAVGETDPRDLLRRGLKVVLRQTKATLAGYLALDASDPLPKVVLP